MYWTCPYCKSNLDFGEVCDCQESKNAYANDDNQNSESVQLESSNIGVARDALINKIEGVEYDYV